MLRGMWLTSPSQEDLTGIPSLVRATPAHSPPTSAPLRPITTDQPAVRGLLCLHQHTVFRALFVPELAGLAVLGLIWCVWGPVGSERPVILSSQLLMTVLKGEDVPGWVYVCQVRRHLTGVIVRSPVAGRRMAWGKT